ncbi:reverse transcriptase domain-containing protein [Enterococcus hulanensis]|uniref:reverse transcriptase domain-containing protein n=1 Tax=Enterococcus hulanensis TaxID=2559929 RepID=UPI0028925AFE|nr:reverse transcriptase domain-containing protein [Enterococcus hulanensis]MDT2660485.1 reverse transcriptase domain-containing protein [Enterococcus hulanensis]
MIDNRVFFRQAYLKDLSEKYIKHYTISGSDRVNYVSFKKNETEIIKNISDTVLYGKYSFSSYKEKLILKDRFSKPRCISIPTIKDRLLLKSLSLLIETYFSDIPKPKIPHEQIKKINQIVKKNEYDSYLKIDIKNFFGNINHEKLLSTVHTKIKSKKILQLIEKGIQNPTGTEKNNIKGLPQGISISNFLAHIYLLNLDEKYDNTNSLEYIRYVDDILIFCSKAEKDNVLKQIRADLAFLGLKIKSSKKKQGKLINLSRDKPLNFLGYSFFYDEKQNFITSINKKSVLSCEQKIVTILNKVNKNPSTKQLNRSLYELNRVITGSITREFDFGTIRTQRYGWLLFFSQMNDKYLLFRLDSLIRKKINHMKKKNPNIEELINDRFESNVKKFVTTYYEIKYNFKATTYLFEPDAFNLIEKRVFLEETFGFSNSKLREMSDKEIEKKFYRNVYKKIYTDYKDILEVMSGY